MIHDREGVRPEFQSYFYQGKEIDTDLTLKECNIQNEATLKLVFKSDRTTK